MANLQTAEIGNRRNEVKCLICDRETNEEEIAIIFVEIEECLCRECEKECELD